MIDIEEDVFDMVSSHILAEYPDAFITGEFVRSPPMFPCVSIIQQDNQVVQRTRTNDCNENHIQMMIELDVYSNRADGRKSECKAIANIADRVLEKIGFTRLLLQPIPNMDDATIYRIKGRYEAVVDKNKVIYRR